jgi:hypothetical protein
LNKGVRVNARAKSGDNLKPSKPTKKFPKIPTGLVSDWQSKISKTSHVTGTQYHRPSSPLGGLADDDACGKRPDSIDHRRDKTRKNEVCLVFRSDERLLIPSAGIKLIAVNDSDSDFIEYVKPRTSAGNKANAKVGVLSSVYNYKGTDPDQQQVEVWDSDPDFIEYKSTATDAGSVPVSGLPSFVRASWVSRFLPTLYHRFGSSEDPWKMFTKGDEMLSIIQEVVNDVYPDNRYRAKWGDHLCNAV